MQDIQKTIKNEILEHLEVLNSINHDEIIQAYNLINSTILSGNKIYIFGNGGSASDAQHFTTELIIKYKNTRKPFPAICLNTDTSLLTACANDFGFEYIFQRQVEALVQPGDLVIAISTSGNSSNIIKGVSKAKELNANIIGFTGDSGILKERCQVCISVKSKNTARIQEVHILAIHIICGLLDE